MDMGEPTLDSSAVPTTLAPTCSYSSAAVLAPLYVAGKLWEVSKTRRTVLARTAS